MDRGAADILGRYLLIAAHVDRDMARAALVRVVDEIPRLGILLLDLQTELLRVLECRVPGGFALSGRAAPAKDRLDRFLDKLLALLDELGLPDRLQRQRDDLVTDAPGRRRAAARAAGELAGKRGVVGDRVLDVLLLRGRGRGAARDIALAHGGEIARRVVRRILSGRQVACQRFEEVG